MPSPTASFVDGQVLSIEGLPLRVSVSVRRIRLGLTVERDGTIILRVPEGCSPERASDFVRGHRAWIEEKSLVRDRFQPVHPSRTLIDGTAFRYLGREYRLLLTDAQSDADGGTVRLTAGRLRLARAAAEDGDAGRKALIGWYQRSGTRWAEGRLQPWAGRMGVPEPAVEVRDLGRRWGTYTPQDRDAEGLMTLHWAVFQLPIRLVDYVIAHELAHIRISDHGPDYWRLLRRGIPEFLRLKDELDDMGRRVWLGETPHGRL